MTTGAGPRTDGERLVAAYLRQRRLSYEYEPTINGRQPDFIADTASGQAVFEVFEPNLRLPGSFGSFDSIEPILGGFEARKAKQIKAVKQAGLPFVLVVGSANSDIPFNEHSVEGAMFGRPGVRIPLDSENPAEDAEWTFLDGARLQPLRNRGVSAVALIRRFNPTMWRVESARRARNLVMGEAGPYDLAEALRRDLDLVEELVERGHYDPEASVARLVTFHNPFADHPLPVEFCGPHDDHHGAVRLGPEKAAWGLIAQGVLRWEVPE